MIITKEWLLANRTNAGAFTKAQAKALGVAWPLKKRWMNNLIGRAISDNQARTFEQAKSQKSQRKKYKNSSLNQ